MIHKVQIAVLFSLLVVRSANADFSCVAEVSYKWAAAHNSQNPAAKDGKKDSKEDSTESSLGTEKEVFWGRFEAKGATEEEGKAKIKEIATRERSNAMIDCADAHENQTKCIAGKYAQNNVSLNMMSFSQRKEFERKIIGDCEQANGRCVGASATEPTCKEIVAADNAQTGQGNDTKSKDAKGKDAKKK